MTSATEYDRPPAPLPFVAVDPLPTGMAGISAQVHALREARRLSDTEEGL